MPATLDEAKALNMTGEQSLVQLFGLDEFYGAEDMVLLNSHLFKFDLEFDRYGIMDLYVELSEKILPDTASVRRGISSWERMYLSQPPMEDVNVCLVKGEKIGKEPPEYEPEYVDDEGRKYAWRFDGGVRLREIMNEAEETFLVEHGSVVAWTKSWSDLRGWAMRYGDWKEKRAERLQHTTEEERASRVSERFVRW